MMKALCMRLFHLGLPAHRPRRPPPAPAAFPPSTPSAASLPEWSVLLTARPGFRCSG
ncbi:unnamed protein product, partial [Musa hybrid cultivar]